MGIRAKESIGNNEELEVIYNVIPEVQKVAAGDWVFIINVMNHLNKHGKAVVSVSNGVTWNGGINTVIREKFVKKRICRGGDSTSIQFVFEYWNCLFITGIKQK